LKINPLRNPDAGEPVMPLKDACIVAMILTLGSFFTVYFPTLTFSGILADPGGACFYAIGFIGGQFFTNLVVLAGLSRYTSTRYREAEAK